MKKRESIFADLLFGKHEIQGTGNKIAYKIIPFITLGVSVLFRVFHFGGAV